jgi:hypothetical protein
MAYYPLLIFQTLIMAEKIKLSMVFRKGHHNAEMVPELKTFATQMVYGKVGAFQKHKSLPNLKGSSDAEVIYCHAVVTVDGYWIDNWFYWIPIQLQLQSITMYTLDNTSVELDTRLATVPQPVFHYNTLLASLAIDSSQLTSSPKTQTLTNQRQRGSQLRAPRYMTSGRTVEKTVLLALVV